LNVKGISLPGKLADVCHVVTLARMAKNGKTRTRQQEGKKGKHDPGRPMTGTGMMGH
jgi:hypothetical protein